MVRARQSAFSIVEMMVVLGVVVVLLVLISSFTHRAVRTSYLATCASNLNQIYLAHQQAAMDADRSNQVVMNPSGWVSRLSPYLDKSRDVFRCPEEPLYGSGFDFDFHMGFHSKRTSKHANINKITHIVSFKDGSEKVRQISVEQYEEMGQLYSTKNVSGGRIKGLVAIANWWSKNMSVRKGSRDPDTTWIVLEPDAGWKTNTHQFHDYLVKVERLEGGTRLTPMRGSANSNEEYAWFVDAHGNDLLKPPGRLVFNESARHVMVDGDSSTNYGANGEALYRSGGSEKILAIDYRQPLVEIDTWHRWDDAQGMPGFARHPANVINMLLLNGAVRQVHPDQITPDFIGNELQYWSF